jgi:hypothetical protein
VNNNNDDDETLVTQRTSPISDGGLSTPHTNFGGGGLGSDTQPGRSFGRSGRGSPFARRSRKAQELDSVDNAFRMAYGTLMNVELTDRVGTLL